MSHSNKTNISHPRPQFRLGSLMVFTTFLCAISAMLAAMNIHPWQVLIAVAWFSSGVGIVMVLLELAMIIVGIRERQRHDRRPLN